MTAPHSLFRESWQLPYGCSSRIHLYSKAKVDNTSEIQSPAAVTKDAVNVNIQNKQESLDVVRRLKLDSKINVHNGCVNTICWNEVGDAILSGSDDQHLNITNPFTKKCLASIHSGHLANIFSAKFLPNTGDAQIVSCSGDGMVFHTVVDREDQYGQHGFDCHFGTTYEIVTVPQDQHTFLTCGEDGTVRWFDLRIKDKCTKEDCKEDILINCRRAVTALAINPMMPYQLAVGCADSSVRIFDRRMLGTRATGNYSGRSNLTGMMSFTAPLLQGRSHRITSLTYSTDGIELLTSFSSDHIYLFNLNEDGRTELKKESTHRAGKLEADADNVDASTSSSPRHPPIKRLRLRGDWSDTGPSARPERDRGPARPGTSRAELHEDQPEEGPSIDPGVEEERPAGEDPARNVTIMQRMSDMLTRWLEGATRQAENRQRTPQQEGQQDTPEQGEGEQQPEQPGPSDRPEEGCGEEREVSDMEPSGGGEEERKPAETVQSEVNDLLPVPTNDEGDCSGPCLVQAESEERVAFTDLSSSVPDTDCGSYLAAEFHAAISSSQDFSNTKKVFKGDLESSPTTSEMQCARKESLSREESPITDEDSLTAEPSITGAKFKNLTLESDASSSSCSDKADEQNESLSACGPDRKDLVVFPTSQDKSGLGIEGAAAGEEVESRSVHSSSLPVDPVVSLHYHSTGTSSSSIRVDYSTNSSSGGPNLPPDMGTFPRLCPDRPTPDRFPAKTEAVKPCEGQLVSDRPAEAQSSVHIEESPGSKENKMIDSDIEKATSSGGTQACVDTLTPCPEACSKQKSSPEEASSKPEEESSRTTLLSGRSQGDKLVRSLSEPEALRSDAALEGVATDSVADLSGEGACGQEMPSTEAQGTDEMPKQHPAHPRPGPSNSSGDPSGRQRRYGHSGPPTGDFQLHSASDDDDSDAELQRASQRSRRRRIGGSTSDEMERNLAAIRLQEMYRKRQEERERQEQEMMNIHQPLVKHVYKGHRNARTMIKEATFWGNNFVMSGSDCGHIFIWDRYTSKLVMLLEADKHVVNCLQPHPFDPVLASSGIDYDVKIWMPTAEEPSFNREQAEEVVRRNQIMLEETRDTITVPASFMLRMLASLNHIRAGQRQAGGVASASSSSDED